MPYTRQIPDIRHYKSAGYTVSGIRPKISGSTLVFFFQGIRDLFRVIYYFNIWVDDPITFDLFDALFNFGYRNDLSGI